MRTVLKRSRAGAALPDPAGRRRTSGLDLLLTLAPENTVVQNPVDLLWNSSEFPPCRSEENLGSRSRGVDASRRKKKIIITLSSFFFFFIRNFNTARIFFCPDFKDLVNRNHLTVGFIVEG